MKAILMKAIMTSISEVMETMFFIPVEPGGELTWEESRLGDEKHIACQLTFSGDVSGRLILTANDHLVAQMTENFMGEAYDTLTDDHAAGTLTEMLNMICGNALGRVDASAPFELGIPIRIDAATIDNESKFAIVDTPDSRLGVQLILD